MAIGIHMMPSGFGGSVPGPGYTGKGFIEAGVRELMRFLSVEAAGGISGLTRLHMNRNPAPVRLVSRSVGGDRSVTIYSNVNERLRDLQTGLLTSTHSVLIAAAERAKEVAISEYFRTLKGTVSWGQPSDTTNIPDVIGYRVFGGRGRVGQTAGIFFGILEDSPKAWAQTGGLSGYSERGN